MEETSKTVGDYVSDFFTQIVGGLPEFLGAVAILIIGYFVAKAIAAGVHNLLGRAQFNQRLSAGTGGSFIHKAIPNPMGMIATIVYWIVFLFAISIAVSVLGIPALVDFVQAVYSYIPNVIAALLIFMVAGAVAGGVVTLVTNAMGDTPTGKIVATGAPIIIMGIAGFMILNQLRIAPEIVTLTYGAIVFSAGLGMALAFGLGGRDVAGKMLGDLYDKGMASRSRVKNKADDLRDRA